MACIREVAWVAVNGKDLRLYGCCEAWLTGCTMITQLSESVLVSTLLQRQAPWDVYTRHAACCAALAGAASAQISPVKILA